MNNVGFQNGGAGYSCKMGKEKRATYKTRIAQVGNYAVNRGENFSRQRVVSGPNVMVSNEWKLVLKRLVPLCMKTRMIWIVTIKCAYSLYSPSITRQGRIPVSAWGH